MSKESVIERIANSCDEMGEVDLAGIKLETADPRLLDVSQMDLDRHVAMQPSAVAYYGALLRESKRKLALQKRSYERWEKKRYAVAKASLAAGTGKSTVADVEARFIVDNEEEIEKWEKLIDRLQFECDTLDVWYEAWRQKSFSIGQHANITDDERFLTPHIKEKFQESGEKSNGIDRVRRIIRKNRDQD